MTVVVEREALMNRIAEAIARFGVAPDQITPDATWEELDVDSLDLVELAQIAEEEYGVDLPVSDMSDVRTPREAVDLIYSRMG